MKRATNPAHPSFQVVHLAQALGMTAYLTAAVYARTWEKPGEKEEDDPYVNPETTRYPLTKIEVNEGMNMVMEMQMRRVAEQYPANVPYELAVDRRLDIPAGEDAWGYPEWRHVWLACFDGFGQPDGRHFQALLDDLSKMFPGKKLYVYNTGSSYHGYVNTVLDRMAHYEMHDMMVQHPKVVDQKWLSLGGGLRWTAGYRRPEPKLTRWYNL